MKLIKAAVFVCVVLLLGSSFFARCSKLTTCTIDQKNPCSCTYNDTLQKKLVTLDIQHYFKKLPVNPIPDEASKYVYTYNPCQNITCEGGSQGTACQRLLRGGGFSLGGITSKNTWIINSMDPKTFQFTINYKGGQGGRTIKVIFTYNTSKTLVVGKVSVNNNKAYSFPVTGSLVQPEQRGGGGSSGGSGVQAGPIGIVIILLAIIGVVTYFVVGGIYMYNVKGARGVEAVPNFEFWKDLPFLIRDGFFFTIKPCYKRKTHNSYQTL